ncbi:ribosome biogenesis protein tsr1 [Cichlidogyrus casuarinus]|uniref:Pre-rRNA-processing protein TSR1 homolog n=1 Tax=Cichlidogyrus casuarinus TaxID=1844966 RepID=A0ABD2QE15_9PLAT
MDDDQDPDENDSDAISVSSLPSDLSDEERANELRRRRLKSKKSDQKSLDALDLMNDGASSCSSWASRSARTMASTVNTAFSEAQLAKFRDARSEETFPDEVETPRHMSAKIRFSNYRGLPRFRGSEWPLDQDPPLPLEYTRTFRFTNYQRNRRTLIKFFLRRYQEAYIGPGSMVDLCIGPMPKDLAESIVKTHAIRPLIVWSLLVYERKMSIVHLNMRRVIRAVQSTAQMQEIARKANNLLQQYVNPGNLELEFGEEASTPAQKSFELMEQEFADRSEVVLEAEPIKSKEPMLFQIGIRRFVACPIYSEVLLTKPDKEKAKYERFFPASGSNTMASMYAPMMYAPQHVLQFRIRSPEDDEGKVGIPYIGELVATGALSSVDPQRLIIKRIYFKPIKLYTKHGAVGHIKQSVGTHGYMKCFFNRQLNSCDVALMPLYKRQLPKWSYTPRITDKLSTEESVPDETESLLKGVKISQGVSFKPQRQQLMDTDDVSMFDA